MHFTTCQSCNEVLQVTWTGQLTHPNCQQTPAEIASRKFVDAIQRGASEDEIRNLETAVNKIDEPPSLGSAALWYAEVAKWPVFPLRPGEKIPATRHGFKDATLDSDRIRAYWEANPMANIGIPTGPISGFDCIDVDGPQGVQSLAELGDDVLPDIHGRVGTPRGFHLLVEATESGNRAGIRPGLDYRSCGGYVCTVPSIVEGARYVWLMRPSPAILGTGTLAKEENAPQR